MNIDRNLVLRFTTCWFNQLDQTNAKMEFFYQIFIALFIELGPLNKLHLTTNFNPLLMWD